MLTRTDKHVTQLAPAALQSGLNGTSEAALKAGVSDTWRFQLARVLRIEWIGQTAASLCWIGSVLAYGISSAGDWLQLCAASAWLLANIAAAVATEDE